MHLVVLGFGDIPVLAEKAAHVATRRAQRKNLRARQKMVERLFLDGVNLQGGGRSVAQAVELAALVDADEAESRLALADVTVARAEIAMDPAAGLRLPPAGLVQRLRFLKELQFAHGGLSSNDYTPIGNPAAQGPIHERFLVGAAELAGIGQRPVLRPA